MNVSKLTQKPFLLILLGITLVGIPLTLYALLQQQIFQQFAWSTQQFAETSCASDNGSATIKVSFANTEVTKDIDVTVNDLQTGNFIDLGTIKHQEVKTGQIVTGKSSLTAGSVLFKLTWTDKSPGSDVKAASYKTITTCSGITPPSNFCPTNGKNDQGLCRWNPLEGAEGYDVVVKDTQSGEVIKSESLSKDASQSAFPMVPGKSYQCSITPSNVCGKGTLEKSSEKICPVATPTPTPLTCPTSSTPQGICRWDELEGVTEYHVTVKEIASGETVKSGTVTAPNTSFAFSDDASKTYQCIVSAVNQCSETLPYNSPPSTCTIPTPTLPLTPTLSSTPAIPSTSPTPTPSPTPTLTPTPSPLPTATPLPTPTLTPTPPPLPTATPLPTPTPVIIVRTLTQPPQTVDQQPQAQAQTVVQQSQSVVQQQTAQTQQSQPRPFVQTTPGPTIVPTGNFTPTFVLVGTSIILLLAGGIVFFIL